MEKISGIIPGSARLTSVDLKDASPVRPGTPSFGRPEGVSSLAKDLSKEFDFATSRKAAGAHAEQMDWRTKDAQQAALASEIADRFFNRNMKPVEPEPMEEMSQHLPSNLPAVLPSEIAVSSKPAGFKTDEIGGLRAASSFRPSFHDEEIENETQLQQPDGLYPKGSFIDRTA